MLAYCTICDKERETRYIDLFVTGSEGTRLCHDCEMLVVEFVRKENERLRKFAVHKQDCDLNMSVEKIIETSSDTLWCTCGFGLIGQFEKE